jgi:zinc protease
MNDTAYLQRLPTHERRLDNGLTVIVREDRSAPVVAVVTHVRAGYFDEPDHLVGISHVLEHMYFKGTANRGAGEIAQETKAAGGYLNAGTIYDHTSYYTVLPASSLEQALDIQADALQRSAIDDEELRKELQVIIQEANRKLDNPSAVAQERLFEAMFDRHRIRRWRIGTEPVLSSFTRDDVWAYYRNLYRAANTILVIAGDVDPDRAFDLAERHYGGMPAGEPIRDTGEDEPDRREFRYRELDGDIVQTCLEWGWRTPGSLHDDTPALDVLAIALGQGRAARLYRGVRDAGVVASISAYNYTPASVGIFGFGAELDPPDAMAALQRMSAVLHHARAHGFTEAEAERARNILEARHVRRIETVEGQANVLADWQAQGDWRLADDYLRRALDVSAERLHEVAIRYLDPEAVTVLLYRPTGGPPLAGGQAAVHEVVTGGPAGPGAVAAADGLAKADPVVQPDDAAVGAWRPAVRASVTGRLAPERVDDGVRFYAVANDARIVVKQRRTAPLVSIALYCRGGVLAETMQTLGTTGLMARTSVRGTRTRSAKQLAVESEGLGAIITPGIGADLLDWTVSMPSRHFAHGLDLLLDTALQPAFDAAEAERERKITLSDLEQLRDDMYQYPLRLAMSEAFAGHPYGVDVGDLERSIRGLDVAGLHDWHADRVLRGAPTVLVVGDVDDPDCIAGEIADRLHGRIDSAVGMQTRPPGWPERAVRRVEQRDKAQTALVLAFPGPPRNHPDAYALQVLSAAIGGLGGRLFEELRSRRSLAYAVSAAPMARWLGGAFIAYIGTAPEREDEARAGMLEELLRTTHEPLDAQELERARRYLIGAWQIRQQTHSRQLADLAHALLLGEGLEELRRFEERISAVTADSVRAAAARWFVADRLVEGVVRGR